MLASTEKDTYFFTMARTKRPNLDRVPVSLFSVIEALSTTRDDADWTSIDNKIKELLRVNKLKIDGKYNARLKRLLQFYEKNPNSLPLHEELSFYHKEKKRLSSVIDLSIIETKSKPIVFELDHNDNLVEVC